MSKRLVIGGVEGAPSATQWVGPAPVPVGRGPRNTLILADPTVSWQHAEVWLHDGAVRVRDLRSSNGTFVNGHRVESEVAVQDGDELRFGSVVTRVAPGDEVAEPPRRSFALVDVATGVSHPLHRDRFRIGPGADADVAADAWAMLVVLVDEVHIVRDGTDDADVPLAVDAPFEVGGRVFRIAEIPEHRVPTVSEAPSGFPYRLEVALEGPLGPRAVLTHLAAGARFQVDTGNRAVLLWFLARRFAEQDDRTPEDRGWCGDGELQTALWGRSGDANKLDVLLHRLRSDLRKVGFDPWFIEKRNRHIRARVAEVLVLDG